MKLTMSSDYALRAVMLLAEESGDPVKRVTMTQMHERLTIPGPFLGKVLQLLVHAGILSGRRGARTGGYRLAKPSSGITIVDIVEAIEGPLCLSRCGAGPDGCPLGETCPAGPVWQAAQKAFRDALASQTIGDLIANGRNAPIPARNGDHSHPPEVLPRRVPAGVAMTLPRGDSKAKPTAHL